MFRDTDIDAETEDDVDLEEFSDELDSQIIEALKSIGCDTAKSVLELTEDDLMRRTGLEEDVVKHVRDILSAEFEE